MTKNLEDCFLVLLKDCKNGINVVKRKKVRKNNKYKLDNKTIRKKAYKMNK
jgi:hypothetical protein